MHKYDRSSSSWKLIIINCVCTFRFGFSVACKFLGTSSTRNTLVYAFTYAFSTTKNDMVYLALLELEFRRVHLTLKLCKSTVSHFWSFIYWIELNLTFWHNRQCKFNWLPEPQPSPSPQHNIRYSTHTTNCSVCTINFSIKCRADSLFLVRKMHTALTTKKRSRMCSVAECVLLAK